MALCVAGTVGSLVVRRTGRTSAANATRSWLNCGSCGTRAVWGSFPHCHLPGTPGLETLPQGKHLSELVTRVTAYKNWTPAGDGRIGCVVSNSAKSLGVSPEALELLKTIKRSRDAIGDVDWWRWPDGTYSFGWLGPHLRLIDPKTAAGGHRRVVCAGPGHMIVLQSFALALLFMGGVPLLLLVGCILLAPLFEGLHKIFRIVGGWNA